MHSEMLEPRARSGWARPPGDLVSPLVQTLCWTEVSPLCIRVEGVAAGALGRQRQTCLEPQPGSNSRGSSEFQFPHLQAGED